MPGDDLRARVDDHRRERARGHDRGDRGLGGFQADGKQCNMAVSGDVYVTGTCRAGTCEQAP